MPDWEELVDACYLKPRFMDMVRAYEDYRMDSAPCKGGVTNQCAVRMSVALGRCGFSLGAFEPHHRVHEGRMRCQLTWPHVLGARELAGYLTRMWGAPETFRGSAAHSAGGTLAGRTGVVYFDNCFKRNRTDTRATGDHIDLWNGTQYYNQIIHVAAGGSAGVGAGLFGLAEAVWFYPLN